MKKNEKVRLIVVAMMILVIVASTFAYLQFNVHADDTIATDAQCPPFGCNAFPARINIKFTYTVKFLCDIGIIGTSTPSDAELIGLEPGFYQTDINIHNPSFREHNATIVKKFILALPEVLDQNSAIQYVTAVPQPYLLRFAILGPDAAMRIDCHEIILLLRPYITTTAPFAKGFVIIYSDTNLLDVWAEYTTQATIEGTDVIAAPAIAIVRIQPQPFTP